jgi:hypothetical protein
MPRYYRKDDAKNHCELVVPWLFSIIEISRAYLREG